MMKDEKFLSVVIPVYNAEHYIVTCLESINVLPSFLGVDDSGIEVVLIDDGSTDGSGALCDELATNSRFEVKVLHKQNGGVSSARNEGLDLCSGKWIWFIDADDYLEIPSNHIDTHNINKDANFVVTGFSWEEIGVVNVFGASSDEVPYNLWRCWFRKDVIEQNHLRFTVGRKYAEDQEFILKYLLTLRNIVTHAIPEPLYHYTIRPGSAMTRKGVRLKKIKDVACVDVLFVWHTIKIRLILQSWVLKEIKRMTKVLFVLIRN